MNDQTTKEKDELMVRYLDGSASPEEETELLQWLGLSEENRNDFLRMQDLWLLCDASSEKAALERFRNRMEGYAAPLPLPPRYRLPGWARTAGVLLLCLAAGYGSAHLFPGKKHPVWNQLITAPDSKGRFVLPDGSVVWLNSNTKLSYPETFRGNERRVSLEGEAYFEVAENKQQPFVVDLDAAGLRIEALGTAFDVAGYPTDSLVETVLVNGSLRISGKTFPHDILLKPNQLLTYHKEKKTAHLDKAKAGLYIDWIKSRLVFDNDCLADIRISMEGWYNLVIDCPQEFAQNTRMSFTIRGERIDEILKAMSFIIPIRYTIRDRHVKITPRE
ncbi:MAG: FecR domain-containing protein [Tannerellaceae bacterium]|jgi:ferric-dicitrate binding protein FerR (iron transport regulator)|nr:FecR domain-containing protein [Tannerellaceae bacterium]